MTTMQLQLEYKDNDFLISYEWLVNNVVANNSDLEIFNKLLHNRKKISALEIFKYCAKTNNYILGGILVEELPFNKTALVVDHVGVDSHLYYNGNVHVTGDMNNYHNIYIYGDLKVDGKISNRKGGIITANHLYTSEIDVAMAARIYAETKAGSIIMTDSAIIFGNTEANHINLNIMAQIEGKTKANNINIRHFSAIYGDVNASLVKLNHAPIYGMRGRIYGNVDADEIINDGGRISGDVNTVKIDNINGGKVDGIITYKSLS